MSRSRLARLRLELLALVTMRALAIFHPPSKMTTFHNGRTKLYTFGGRLVRAVLCGVIVFLATRAADHHFLLGCNRVPITIAADLGGTIFFFYDCCFFFLAGSWAGASVMTGLTTGSAFTHYSFPIAQELSSIVQ